MWGSNLLKYQVPIKSLTAIINPLDGEMWKVEAINPQEVRDAVDRGDFAERSWGQVKDELSPEFHRNFHICRIAWLLGVELDAEDSHKLTLAVIKDRAWLVDGNHRVAAAIVRGDDNIILHIAHSGEEDLVGLLPGLISLSDCAAAGA